ncbi:MAG: hypothetical protein ABIP51_17780 [Bacteroidia bacterium]
MNKYLFYLLFAFCTITANAQSSPEGKKYVLLTDYACAKMEGGGCSINTYKVFEFIKDKVFIYTLVKASCTSKEREENYNKDEPVKSTRYWTIKNNKIFVEKYDEYGKMELNEDKIIAKKGKTVTEFLEQH